jgi:hypothetical protein
MFIMLRAIMILVCAYAGWETAGRQVRELPKALQSSSPTKADDGTKPSTVRFDGTQSFDV